MVWKKGRRVISAGTTITAIDRRFRLVGAHDLEITRVRVKDAGTFTCSVSTEPLMELTHSVDILCKYLSSRLAGDCSRQPADGGTTVK